MIFKKLFWKGLTSWYLFKTRGGYHKWDLDKIVCCASNFCGIFLQIKKKKEKSFLRSSKSSDFFIKRDKSLFERTRLKNQKKNDDTKELEKKVLKKGMNNVRKRNKHKQKKHQREQINVRSNWTWEEETWRDKKKEKRHGEKRENKNDERESNSGRVRTRRVNTKIKRINLFFEVFFFWTETKR